MDETAADGEARVHYRDLPAKQKLAALVEYLEGEGNAADIGNVGSKFGTKRAQLQHAGFLIGDQDENGQFLIALPAENATKSMKMLRASALATSAAAKGKGAKAQGKRGDTKGKGVEAKGKGGCKAGLAAPYARAFPMVMKGAYVNAVFGTQDVGYAGGKSAYKGYDNRVFSGAYGDVYRGSKGDWRGGFAPVPLALVGGELPHKACAKGGVWVKGDRRNDLKSKGEGKGKTCSKGKSEMGKNGKGKSDKSKNVTPLDKDRVGEIRDYLTLEGGKAPAAVIGSKFNAKRSQLEAEGFIFGAPDAHGQCTVQLPAGEYEIAAEIYAAAVGDEEAEDDGIPALSRKRIKKMAREIHEQGGFLILEQDSLLRTAKQRKQLEDAGFLFSDQDDEVTLLSPENGLAFGADARAPDGEGDVEALDQQAAKRPRYA
eukprot:TRINITY_DN352_c0_g2_i2.p1 TRINITY_DN352_c0_g2~~TRINITY_DN352_c0_g2_i2.p1  ORF type:complete len:449 (-),score=95.11 TRINITY_DN352_c0_g2_i2:285-1571(-)